MDKFTIRTKVLGLSLASGALVVGYVFYLAYQKSKQKQNQEEPETDAVDGPKPKVNLEVEDLKDHAEYQHPTKGISDILDQQKLTENTACGDGMPPTEIIKKLQNKHDLTLTEMGQAVNYLALCVNDSSTEVLHLLSSFLIASSFHAQKIMMAQAGLAEVVMAYISVATSRAPLLSDASTSRGVGVALTLLANICTVPPARSALVDSDEVAPSRLQRLCELSIATDVPVALNVGALTVLTNTAVDGDNTTVCEACCPWLPRVALDVASARCVWALKLWVNLSSDIECARSVWQNVDATRFIRYVDAGTDESLLLRFLTVLRNSLRADIPTQDFQEAAVPRLQNLCNSLAIDSEIRTLSRTCLLFLLSSHSSV